jgi:hypothetical protein
MRILKITLRSFTSLFFALLIVFVRLPATAHAEDGMAHEVEGTTWEKTIYFPQFQPVQSVYNEDYMLFRIVGKLALSDECLRIVLGNRSYLLIWPGWYAFDIINRDIVVTVLRTGSVVAQLKLGDTLSLSGGELEDRPVGLKYTIPGQCQGPYWAVGDIGSVQTKKDPFNSEKHTSKSENKPFKTEKHLKDSKRFSYHINQLVGKPDKEPSKSNKEFNRSAKALQKSGKAPQKPVMDINKPSKRIDNIDDKELEDSIVK